MEDADVVLDKEIEELSLDRPPCSILALGGSETSVKDIFKDVNKAENEYQTIVSSRLTTCLIDKPLSCQDGTFDPLSSSEKNIDVGSVVSDNVSSEYALDASDNDIVEIHSPDLIIPDTIYVVSSSTPFSPHSQSQGILEYNSSQSDKESTIKYSNSKNNLVSCLKGDQKNGTIKTKTRYVHFTDEPGIVTEFIEPVNPWRDMRTPSKGEVVSFYKNVCQKLKCKSLDKVIKQIQDAPDLSTRSGTLVLRGCRLDNRSCEALESVFKRVQFENLDLENCNLEEDGATAILEMIEFYHSTCKLNIACNPKIGLRGWQALCRMLRKTPCLTYLDARRTILTEMTMPTFGRCLKADPYLKVLHLEGVFLSGRPLLILTTALKYNRLLEELYLGDNDLTSSDGPSLGAMLTYNTTLQLLDLRNNQLKDIGLAHIGNGLSDQSEQPCGGLCSLITWNNGLTHEGMSYLCEALVKTTTLKALNLGQNRIGDLGLQKLKPGLIKNKSLRKLGFLNTKLGSEGAVALAEVLADSWSITRIDIRENNVQTAGLMAFSMALKVNKSLLRLDLDKDIRKEPGMETVMQSVLVDIYNLCYRNKQLIKRSITPSLSASTHSISNTISRQSSTSSEINEPFCFEDVFHPEAATQEVIPYSPVNECPIDVNAQIIFSTTNKVVPSKHDSDHTPSTESLGNSISPVFESSKRGRTYSDPVRKNPDPALNEKRTSRFSVTKILDSLGNHAAGVANKFAQMDNKLKKQHSKEKSDAKSSELMPVLDQNQPAELDQFKSVPAQTSLNSSDDISLCTAVSNTKEISGKSDAVNLVSCVTSDEIFHITEKSLCSETEIMEDAENKKSGKETSCDIPDNSLTTQVKHSHGIEIVTLGSTSEYKPIAGNGVVGKVNEDGVTNTDNIVELIDEILHINDKAMDNLVDEKNSDINEMSDTNILMLVNNDKSSVGIELDMLQMEDSNSSTENIESTTEIFGMVSSIDCKSVLSNKLSTELADNDECMVNHNGNLIISIDLNIEKTEDNKSSDNEIENMNESFGIGDNINFKYEVGNDSDIDQTLKHPNIVENVADIVEMVNDESVVGIKLNIDQVDDIGSSTKEIEKITGNIDIVNKINDKYVIPNELNIDHTDIIENTLEIVQMVNDTSLIGNVLSIEQTKSDECSTAKIGNISEHLGMVNNINDVSLIRNELSIQEMLDDEGPTKEIVNITENNDLVYNINDSSLIENEINIEHAESDETEEIVNITESLSIVNNIKDTSLIENELNIEQMAGDECTIGNIGDMTENFGTVNNNNAMSLIAGAECTIEKDFGIVTNISDMYIEQMAVDACTIEKIGNITENFGIVNNIIDTSLIENELNIEQAEGDTLGVDKDETRETSLVDGNLLHEKCANSNEITNITPTLEYVKINESLNEEKSIYKPYLQFVLI